MQTSKARGRACAIWFPKVINSDWRWLERARWRERCTKNFFYDAVRHWWGIEWLDLERGEQ